MENLGKLKKLKKELINKKMIEKLSKKQHLS